jgi:hypothetical protein
MTADQRRGVPSWADKGRHGGGEGDRRGDPGKRGACNPAFSGGWSFTAAVEPASGPSSWTLMR